jgi:hypothetical protein
MASNTNPLAAWDAAAVAAWVDSLGIRGVEGALFAAEPVTGDMLLMEDFDDAALVDLGITRKLSRVSLLARLRGLRAEVVTPPPYTPTAPQCTHSGNGRTGGGKGGTAGGACNVFISHAGRKDKGLTPACEHVLQRDGKFHLPSAMAAIDALKQRSNTAPLFPPAAGSGGGGAAAVVAPASEPWWRLDGAWTRDYADVLSVFFR